jgi:hypothetical protein
MAIKKKQVGDWRLPIAEWGKRGQLRFASEMPVGAEFWAFLGFSIGE